MERPAVLQSTGSQRDGHDWVTEQQQHSLREIKTHTHTTHTHTHTHTLTHTLS